MIQHHGMPDGADSPEAFIFAELGGFTCSICAPLNWTQGRVELFASAQFGTDGWQAVDVADVIGGQLLRYKHTPNPCNEAPELRQHWFLIRNP